MFWIILITSILTIVGLVSFGVSLWVRNVPGIVFSFLYTILSGALLGGAIDCAEKGNRRTVTYSFPSESYSFEKAVTVNLREAIVDGQECMLVDCDTTYILKGVEPIFNVGDAAKKLKVKTVEYGDKEERQ